jgi:phosphate:Na+ symporter
MDDTVDELYSAIKYYLTKISREALGEEESRRWTDIISFTINMEQIGDIIERVLIDIEDKKIKKGRSSRRPAWPRSASCTPGWSTTCAWA